MADKEANGWNRAKLSNSESATQGMIYPELVIDVREVYSGLRKQELKEIIGTAVKELFPVELAGGTGNNS